MRLPLILSSILSISASHFDDLASIDNLKFDQVRFLTKKDCALDNYPHVSTITNYVQLIFILI